ncbi:hypothetical protein [Burkholderia alba]|uniref:hypothetical protein n=1 Tax=Burkholderia alba TaxID=2683677 RepID=UPI002B051CCB|nr:hypothetical protein [Burkholderia alba]
MIRNAIGLLFHLAASFVVLVVEMLLIWAPSVPAKRWGVGVSLLIAAVLYALGTLVGAFAPRLRPVGIGLLVTSAITLLDVLALAAMRLFPALLSILAAANHGIAIEVPVSGLMRGAAAGIALGLVGWWLAMPPRRG